MKQKKVSMKIINPHCAGIDVGSRSHYVAIGQMDKDVQEFGVYADDLKQLCRWLKKTYYFSCPGINRNLLAKPVC